MNALAVLVMARLLVSRLPAPPIVCLHVWLHSLYTSFSPPGLPSNTAHMAPPRAAAKGTGPPVAPKKVGPQGMMA